MEETPDAPRLVINETTPDGPKPRRGGAGAARITDIREMRSRDVDALARYRAGDRTVIGELYEKYHAMWERVALRLTRNRADAEDLLAEALARTIEALEAGGGPEGNFSAYVIRSMRNYHENDRASSARRTTHSTDDVEQTLIATGATSSADDAAIERLPEVEALRRAFLTLPDNWRNVLWLTEIEGKTPLQLTERLGMSANAIAALSKRARDGLKLAYVQQELPAAHGQDCGQFSAALIARATTGAEIRSDSLLVDHAARCPECRARLNEANRLAESMRTLTVPALLGVSEMARRGAWAAMPLKAIVAGVAALAVVVVGGVAIAQARAGAAPAPERTEGSVAAPSASILATTAPSPKPSAPAQPTPAVTTPVAEVAVSDSRPVEPTPQATGPSPTPEVSTRSLSVGLDTSSLARGAATLTFEPIATGETATVSAMLPDGARLVSLDGSPCADDQCELAGPSSGPYELRFEADRDATGWLEISVQTRLDDLNVKDGGIGGEVTIPGG